MDLDSLRTRRKRRSEEHLLAARWKAVKQVHFQPTLGFHLTGPVKRKSARTRSAIPAGGKVHNLPHRLLVLDDGRLVVLRPGQDVMVKSGQKEPWFAHIIQVFQYWTVEDLEAEPSASGRLPQPHTAVFLRWYDRICDSTAKGSNSGQVKAALAAAVMHPLLRLKWANSSDDMKGHYDCSPISTIMHPVRVRPDASTPGVFLTDGLVLEE